MPMTVKYKAWKKLLNFAGDSRLTADIITGEIKTSLTEITSRKIKISDQ